MGIGIPPFLFILCHGKWESEKPGGDNFSTRSFFIFLIFRNLFQPATEDFAQLAKCIGADMILMDEFILRNALLLHGCPQLVIYDHKKPPRSFYHRIILPDY